MKILGFKTCIDCCNKQSSHLLPKGRYYCPIVKNIIPKGIVHYDTDASECIQRGVYKPYPKS